MEYHLLEVAGPRLVYICLGGFIVAFSMFSLLMKQKFYINEVVLGTAFGIILGPHVANIFNPHTWGDRPDTITLELTRIVLANAFFAIGAGLPQSYMTKHAKGLFVMAVPTMTLGWVVVVGLIYELFPRLTFIPCLVIAACLVPTDPIVCTSIVGSKYAKKNLSPSLRELLSAESAVNNGLAFPFLTMSLYLICNPAAYWITGLWTLVGCLYQIISGVVIGAILGLIFSFLMKFSHRHQFINRESYVPQYLALVMFTTGVVNTIGSDGLLAAFAAGSAISWDCDFNAPTEETIFSSTIDLVLNCICFIYIGAWLPFTSFDVPSLGITPWRLTALFLAILALRRIPGILMFHQWIPEISTRSEAIFSGHFGSMGVGAVFLSSLASHALQKSDNALNNEEALLAACLQPIVAFVVLSSIIIHGLSIPFLSLRNYTRTKGLALPPFKAEFEGDTSVYYIPSENTENLVDAGLVNVKGQQDRVGITRMI